MGKLIDLTGRRFERLEVVERAGTKNRKAMWLCKCDCGNTSIHATNHLISGFVKSCGCLASEIAHNRLFIDGRRSLKLYNVWCAMKHRCANPNNKAYVDYGGRGITVCEEWRDDFWVFYSWAIKGGYKDGLTLERKNNDGNYRPDNCTFATRTEQVCNRRVQKNSKTGVAGVYFIRGKWQAQITYQHKTYNLGAFASFEEAVNARKQAEIDYWGKREHAEHWRKYAG